MDTGGGGGGQGGRGEVVSTDADWAAALGASTSRCGDCAERGHFSVLIGRNLQVQQSEMGQWVGWL